MSWQIFTDVEAEPVSTAEVKAHLRIDDSGSDSVIAYLIKAARQQLEHELQKALAEQTIDLTLDAFPSGAIELPVSPATAVTYVKYIATSGTLTTIDPANYSLDGASEPSAVQPVFGYAWPTVREVANAVTVRFVAGYATLPSAIKSRLLMLVGELFENRESAAVLAGQRQTFGQHLTDRYWRPGV